MKLCVQVTKKALVSVTGEKHSSASARLASLVVSSTTTFAKDVNATIHVHTVVHHYLSLV